MSAWNQISVRAKYATIRKEASTALHALIKSRRTIQRKTSAIEQRNKTLYLVKLYLFLSIMYEMSLVCIIIASSGSSLGNCNECRCHHWIGQRIQLCICNLLRKTPVITVEKRYPKETTKKIFHKEPRISLRTINAVF